MIRVILSGLNHAGWLNIKIEVGLSLNISICKQSHLA